jgi:hypothetical protein
MFLNFRHRNKYNIYTSITTNNYNVFKYKSCVIKTFFKKNSHYLFFYNNNSRINLYFDNIILDHYDHMSGLEKNLCGYIILHWYRYHKRRKNKLIAEYKNLKFIRYREIETNYKNPSKIKKYH